MTRGSRALALGAAGLLGAPAPASAHGLVQRANLPIPEWLFGWAAAIVLVVSFVGLALLWQRPRLAEDRWRPVGPRVPRAVDVALGALGVLLLAVVVLAGLLGSDSPADNLAPTFVFITAWVGLAFGNALLGDVARALNPWRALGAALRLEGRRPYPERWGRWPAVLALLAFTWVELVSGWAEQPRLVALVALAYTAWTLAMAHRYGIRTWLDRGECFAVYFGVFAALAPFERRGDRLGVRPPLGGVPRLPADRGMAALVLVMIGTVSFDGLSQGALWRDGPEAWFGDASVVAGTLGLLATCAVVVAFYVLGMRGVARVGGGQGAGTLGGAFAHTLVPIAFVYVVAHYLTYLLFEGQATIYLASDPLGRGWDLLGTASTGIDFGVIGQNLAWYLQVGFVVAGHMAALALAHDRALVLFRAPKRAVASQWWMLGIMVGFTMLALWLLAAAGA